MEETNGDVDDIASLVDDDVDTADGDVSEGFFGKVDTCPRQTIHRHARRAPGNGRHVRRRLAGEVLSRIKVPPAAENRRSPQRALTRARRTLLEQRVYAE